MESKGKSIISQFDSKIGLLNNLRLSSEQLIRSLLNLNNINPHQITSRIKERLSLENKIIKKNYKYDSLEDITDIVGIRIITYFEDEIDLIANILEKEFIVDLENSVDKRLIAADKFGYRSLHFVVSYSPSRLKLSEYSIFKNLKFEIQIRSILQHSWAEIEHDIGYKGENEIPDSAKRTFYRVAALLEQADIEFVKLKTEIKEYESSIDSKVKGSPSSVGIDKASLISFLTQSEIVREIEDKVIKSKNGLMLVSIDPSIISDDRINMLRHKDVNTIADLEVLYKKYGDEMVKEQIEKFKNERYSGFMKGASIIWLLKQLA